MPSDKSVTSSAPQNIATFDILRRFSFNDYFTVAPMSENIVENDLKGLVLSAFGSFKAAVVQLMWSGWIKHASWWSVRTYDGGGRKMRGCEQSSC